MKKTFVASLNEINRMVVFFVIFARPSVSNILYLFAHLYTHIINNLYDLYDFYH